MKEGLANGTEIRTNEGALTQSSIEGKWGISRRKPEPV